MRENVSILPKFKTTCIKRCIMSKTDQLAEVRLSVSIVVSICPESR